MSLGNKWLAHWDKTRKHYEKLAKGRCVIRQRHWDKLETAHLDSFIREQESLTVMDLLELQVIPTVNYISKIDKGD
jgi:hypothetical protein